MIATIAEKKSLAFVAIIWKPVVSDRIDNSDRCDNDHWDRSYYYLSDRSDPVAIIVIIYGNHSPAGREKVGRWNEQSALQAMCDAEKDWHERPSRASGAFGSQQNLPLNKLEISFSLFIFQPAVHYD